MDELRKTTMNSRVEYPLISSQNLSRVTLGLPACLVHVTFIMEVK